MFFQLGCNKSCSHFFMSAKKSRWFDNSHRFLKAEEKPASIPDYAVCGCVDSLFDLALFLVNCEKSF